MIHVIATIQTVDGKRDEVVKAIQDNLENVRAEDGCIEYGPTIDVATDIPVQVGGRENVVTMMEKWESLDALNAHLAAPHMASFRERVNDLVENVSLQVVEPV